MSVAARTVGASAGRPPVKIDMHRVNPGSAPSADSVSKLPGWQQLSGDEQQQLVSLMQNPAAFSQLLALQQAMLGFQSPGPVASPSTVAPFTTSLRTSHPGSLEQQAHRMSQLSEAQSSCNTAPSAAAQHVAQLRQPLPSPPRFDRSLLQAPLPFWAGAPACDKPADVLAAQTNAHQRSRSGFDMPSAPIADFSNDLFRSHSLGTNFGSNALPAELSAELSLRASSMPGSYQDIAARLHLNRAGITTATTSMIPVMSQEWLVIPFGTAQQLLPVYAGDVLAEPDGDAVMLIDETGQNWPMKCVYNRAEGRFQLGDGWKPFAQHWNLGHGEQLQLSRCFVSGGCIWLDVKIMQHSLNGSEGCSKRKRDEGGVYTDSQSHLPAWAAHPSAQAPAQSHQAPSAMPEEAPATHLAQSSHVDRQAEPSRAPAAKGPIISVKRLISCPTYCSRLHVNQHMAEHLLPLLPEASNVKPPLPYVYQSLFKHKVKIVDEYGAAWPVQYEGFVSAAQRHYRFTAGWTNLVKQKGIKVGDAVILERWTEDRFNLQMHIIKDASEENIAAVTGSKSKAKRGTARAAGPRITKPRSPSKRSPRGGAICSPAAQGQSPSNGPSGQGYSPSRGHSSALEALHDAALMCASPSSLPSGSQMAQVASGGILASNMTLSQPLSHGGSMVSAAVVAAADAAALNPEDSRSSMANEIRAEEDGYAQEQGRAAFGDRSLDRISNSISKGVS